MLRRPLSLERGASFIEYGAVVLLVAGIAAAVFLVAVPTRVSELISHGMDCIIQLGSCKDTGEASGGQTAPEDDSPSEPESDRDGTPSDTRGFTPDEYAGQSEYADIPEEEGRPENADLPENSEQDKEPVDAEPVSFLFFGGDDDPQLAPGPETKPDEVNDWWESLSEAERAEVIREEPEHIRDLDGIPAAVRNELNRAFLTDEIDRMLEEEGLTRDEVRGFDLDQVRDNPVDGAPTLELWELTKLEATLNGEGEDYYLLALDPEEERSIVSTGNPDTADNVATLVPGTGIEWTAVNGQLGRAENLHAAAEAADNEADHAVIAWIGYDSPGTLLGASNGGAADDGKDDLQDFQYGLRTTHEGDPSNNTLIGHSYGSVVVGHAAQNNSGVYVDNLALVGSPGVGSELSELNFDGGVEDIHVVMSESDWINDWHGFHSFDELMDSEATYVDTQSETEHDKYFNNPETMEMFHLGEVIAGRRDD